MESNKKESSNLGGFKNLRGLIECQQEEIETLKARIIALEQENQALKQQLQPKKRAKKLEHLTKSDLQQQWLSLSLNWQKALNHTVLSRGEITDLPTERELRQIFSANKLELVGNGILIFGLHQLSFQLTDLSGLVYFPNLIDLNISGNALKNLNGIEVTTKLEHLNCTSNKITTLRKIRYLKQLKTLIIRDNKLTTLTEIQHLQELAYLDILYNKRLKDISKLKTLPNLKQLFVFDYKAAIRESVLELKRMLPDLEVGQ